MNIFKWFSKTPPEQPVILYPLFTFRICSKNSIILMETQFRGYFPGTFSVTGTVERAGVAAYASVSFNGRVIIKSKITAKRPTRKGSYLTFDRLALVAGDNVSIKQLNLELPTI